MVERYEPTAEGTRDKEKDIEYGHTHCRQVLALLAFITNGNGSDDGNYQICKQQHPRIWKGEHSREVTV